MWNLLKIVKIRCRWCTDNANARRRATKVARDKDSPLQQPTAEREVARIRNFE